MVINDVGDLDAAIKFVKERDEDPLWKDLITRGVKDAAFTGKLLEHVGTHVDPLVVIDRIPDGMEIPGLRDKLVKIIKDYNAQTSLSEGCAKILTSDNLGLCKQQARVSFYPAPLPR